MTKAESKARAMIAELKIQDIIEQFELTEKMAVNEEVARVRGWLMDELESRNPEAFDNWLDYGYDESPRAYFIG